MTKEEIKKYIRNQIDFSIKRQAKSNKDAHYLYYNNSYIRALKSSTITGNIVNKENFTGGEKFFEINIKNKTFWYYSKIRNYLKENYSENYNIRLNLIEEVFKDYDEYKGYMWGMKY